jgi:hypothetical protein
LKTSFTRSLLSERALKQYVVTLLQFKFLYHCYKNGIVFKYFRYIFKISELDASRNNSGY